MPFLKGSFLLPVSGKNQKKYSHSEKPNKSTELIPPDSESVNAFKKGVPLRLARASLTVEAALAVPIFFIMIICLTSIMGIYSQTLSEMASLRDTAQSAAAAIGAADEKTWIELPGTVSFTPFFLPAGLGGINVCCIGSARGWSGRDEEDASKETEAAQYVYVTENGTVYHTSSKCTHINLSITEADASSIESLRNENGAKYQACEKCAQNAESCDTVYVTDYGDKYHCSSSCSALKRTVRMVDISTVGDLKECSRCQSKAS